MGKLAKFLKIISSTAFTVVIVLALLLVGVRIFGIQVYTVLSGSMEPTYHTGSVLYVKPIDANELKNNDVITFKLQGGTIATHRIVEVVQDETTGGEICYRTKGDANDVADANLISQDRVIGKPIFSIPYLGFLAHSIQSPPGIYLALAISAIIVLFAFFGDFEKYILAGDDKKKKEK